VERAVVRPAALPASGPSLEPDPTIVVRGTPEPSAAPPASPRSRLADRLGLALDVRIERNAWVRRADANIELGGRLGLEKAPGGPLEMGGRIRLLRGWYAFQGRRFTIEDGTVTFAGAAPPEPAFDVTASYEVPRYRILVHVGGSGEKPTLTLSSEPPLEQADILAVLLFGKPTSELGRGQSVDLQRQAAQIAAGYVVPELQASVMETLGVDTLSVELPQDPASPGRVSVGRYVAGDVFVSLAQEFGARAAQIMSLEYGLTPRISVRGSTSTRGDSAVDVFWHRRY
jgi:translocation and assembly module TamB